MNADQIQNLFTSPSPAGRFHCARWGRPIVPVIFGVDDATLSTVKGAIEVVVFMAGHRMAETDPELGANLMVFFLRDWAELPDVPSLEQMIPGLGPLCARLKAEGANQYRTFRFDKDGSIKAAFLFLRMDEHLSAMAAEDLALVQASQLMLTWAEGAFSQIAPLARGKNGATVLNPELGLLIRAAYASNLPVCATDPSHALRLYARLQLATALATQQAEQGAEGAHQSDAAEK